MRNGLLTLRRRSGLLIAASGRALFLRSHVTYTNYYDDSTAGKLVHR
jgi:hypothetical protein